MKATTREEWRATYLFCFACGRTSFRGEGYDETIGPWHFEVHEIARGNHRKRALTEPAAWLQLCEGTNGGCHTNMDGAPIVYQLALKKMHDPEHYNRETVNRLRRRAADAITEAEVDAVVKQLESGVAFDDRRNHEGDKP
jgi:hypothetical protein